MISSSEEQIPLNNISNEDNKSKRPTLMKITQNFEIPIPPESNPLTNSPISTIQNANPTEFIQCRGTTLIRVYLATFMNIPHCSELDVFIELECSLQATAESILELLAAELNIKESEAKECFGLWICSPLLGMQLKLKHKALSIMSIWKEFLKAYSDADEQKREEDIPIVCLRRNIFLTRERQRELMEEKDVYLNILYQDAKSCVLRGEYLLDLKNIIELAAVGFAIDAPKDDKSEKVMVEYMKKNLEKILYKSLANEIFEPMLLGKTFNKSNYISTVYKKFVDLRTNAPKENMKKYLELLMTSCYSYGSAMFRMKMEIPDNSPIKLLKPSSKKLIDVNVGINLEFMTISHKKKYLLATDISGCVSGECNFKGIKNDQNSVVLCFTNEDNVNAALHLYGSKSELMHHLLKNMNSVKNHMLKNMDSVEASEEQAPESPKVFPGVKICKAYMENGLWNVQTSKTVLCA